MKDKIRTKKSQRGFARAASLTPERRLEISKKAIAAKLDKSIPIATHGREDKPLIIGNIKIPCYVLNNQKRVLVQREVASAIGLLGTSGVGLKRFSKGKLIDSFLTNEFREILKNPIKFKIPKKSGFAYGYEAKILTELCDCVLEARKSGKLLQIQEHIANQCELLMRAFAKVGIIALIDEATGFQEDRTKNALATLLEAFIAKELQPWVRTFPLDFYKELYRLRKIDFDPTPIMPQYFGNLTNNIIYKRLAPGILEELKKITPRDDKGRPAVRYFQSLTPNQGYLKLREHISSVVTLMKVSLDYEDFIENLDTIHPLFKIGE